MRAEAGEQHARADGGDDVKTHAPWKSAAVVAAVPSTATRMAMPIAEPTWRPIVMTPTPVAKRAGGSSDAPAPVSVGSMKPTPIPVRIIPGRYSVA